MPITTFRFDATTVTPIEAYSSAGAASCELARGHGENHVHAVHFEPGGIIGPHLAGFDQLLLAVNGSGWVAGEDGVRQAIDAESGAFIPRGEVHSKGSDSGMVAVLIQASGLWRHPGR